MTGSTTRSTLLALVGRTPLRSDAVQSRVSADHPRTHSEELQSAAANTRQSTKLGTHPGDILYWTACVGGAGLLLLFALR